MLTALSLWHLLKFVIFFPVQVSSFWMSTFVRFLRSCLSGRPCRKLRIKLLRLTVKPQPVTYKWLKDDEEDVGVIAQDVAEVAPLLVKEDSDALLRVDYPRLACYCLRWLHLLSDELAAIKNRPRWSGFR